MGLFKRKSTLTYANGQRPPTAQQWQIDLIEASAASTLAFLTDTAAGYYARTLLPMIRAGYNDLAEHLTPDDRIGMAFTFEPDIPEQREPYGVMLVLEGKTILTWTDGPERAQIAHHAVLPISAPEQFVMLGLNPSTTGGIGGIKVRLDGPPSFTIEISNEENMDVALTTAQGVPNGGVRFNH